MTLNFARMGLVILLAGLETAAFAGDISWSGLYRFEGIQIHNLEVGANDIEKSYALHHLVLRPQIVAADGLLIRSRFDVFNANSYPNSQVGQFLGNGPRGSAGVGAKETSNINNSNVISNVQASDTIAVNELYLTWIHEFGSLVVGRTPLQFGLGMSYSAGNGEFDHWFDNRDLIGYKMVFGNMSLMPMYGKMHEGMRNGPNDISTGGGLGHEDDINDIMVQFEYDNADTGTKLGVFHLTRVTTVTGADAPAGTRTGGANEPIWGGANAVNQGNADFKLTQWNLFLEREFKELKIGVEAGFTNGSLGIRTGSADNAEEVGIGGFGIATETIYKPQSSKYTWSLKAGMASGDQSGTDGKVEAFYFNRNYHVAELMFNHPLGKEDFLRTTPMRGDYIATANGGLSGSQTVDTEMVSNAVYLSPSVARPISDTWFADARLTYAILHSGPLKDTSVDKDLGFELDFAGTYKPYDRFTWRSELSLLFPGEAFVGGNRGYEHNFAWGVTTKAAIRF